MGIVSSNAQARGIHTPNTYVEDLLHVFVHDPPVHLCHDPVFKRDFHDEIPIKSVAQDGISDGAGDKEVRKTAIVVGNCTTGRSGRALIARCAFELEGLDKLKKI